MCHGLKDKPAGAIIFVQRLSDGSMDSLVYKDPMDIRRLPSALDMKQDWIDPDAKAVGSAVIHQGTDGRWNWLWMCDDLSQKRHPIEYLNGDEQPVSAKEWSDVLLSFT